MESGSDFSASKMIGLPMAVYLELSKKNGDSPLGRIIIKVNQEEAPRYSQQLRMLCTGETGPCFKGSTEIAVRCKGLADEDLHIYSYRLPSGGTSSKPILSGFESRKRQQWEQGLLLQEADADGNAGLRITLGNYTGEIAHPSVIIGWVTKPSLNMLAQLVSRGDIATSAGDSELIISDSGIIGLPMAVYLELSKKNGNALGRIIIKVNQEEAPRYSQQLRLLCTGETGPSFKGSTEISVSCKGASWEDLYIGSYRLPSEGTSSKPILSGFESREQQQWERGLLLQAADADGNAGLRITLGNYKGKINNPSVIIGWVTKPSLNMLAQLISRGDIATSAEASELIISDSGIVQHE